MEQFLAHAQKLNFRGVLFVAWMQGGFFAVGISWNAAILAAVGEILGDSDTTLAKLLNAFAITFLITLVLFVGSYVLAAQPPASIASVMIGDRRRIAANDASASKRTTAAEGRPPTNVATSDRFAGGGGGGNGGGSGPVVVKSTARLLRDR